MAKTKTQRGSMVFYRSFYESIKELEPEQRAQVYDAIFDFGLNGVEPKISGVAKSIFTLIKPQIVANNAKYTNGQKGGRPRKTEEEQQENEGENSTETEPNANRENTKTKPRKNLKETKGEPQSNHTETKPKRNENENENENDKYSTDVERACARESCPQSAGEETITYRQKATDYLKEKINVEWYRARVAKNYPQMLDLLDQYIATLQRPWSAKDLKDLMRIDEQCFSKIFNALWRDMDGENTIENVNAYVWKSVHNCAKETQHAQAGS